MIWTCLYLLVLCLELKKIPASSVWPLGEHTAACKSKFQSWNLLRPSVVPHFFVVVIFLPPKMWSRNFFDNFQDWHMSGSLLHAAQTTIDLHIAEYFLTRIFVWALYPVYPLEQMVPCPAWDHANRCTEVITCTCLNLPDLKKRCPLPVFDPMVADGLMPRFGSREQMPHATWCWLTLRSTICG